MWKFILLLCLISNFVFAQNDFIGKSEILTNENGVIKHRMVLNPMPFDNAKPVNPGENSFAPLNSFNNSAVRWNYTEPAAIGDYCATSGNGQRTVVGWNLNNHRVSLYNNLSSTPIWEFPTDINGFTNFVSISDNGGVVAVGSYHNIYLFADTGNVPFFNYDLTRLIDTGIAGPVDITRDGSFLVCNASRLDSSTVFGFNAGSTTPVWSKKIIPTVAAGGAGIQGIRMSGNDSFVIVNTYAEVFVLNTYTGAQRYRGLINPGSPNTGTQAAQGINGDGSVIATINYSGLVTSLQWDGSTYNLQWVNQEPPGMFFNWYTSVDVSYDGNYIAAGTLNFITTSSYDGKVKLFKRSAGNVPQWTFTGAGDYITNVAFSQSGNVLSASSWGELNNLTDDLYLFKTFMGNVPFFRLNTPGSFFDCSSSNDASTVTASGKAVHARQFGNGGILYNVDVDTNDIPTYVNPGNLTAEGYQLGQNYPNPFNPNTKIFYSLPVAQNVLLKVFNVLGEEIITLVNERQNSGAYEVEFNGSGFSSGVYFYKLQAGDFTDTKKFVLSK